MSTKLLFFCALILLSPWIQSVVARSEDSRNVSIVLSGRKSLKASQNDFIPFIRLDYSNISTRKQLCAIKEAELEVKYYKKKRVRNWCKSDVDLSLNTNFSYTILQVANGETGSTYQFRILGLILDVKNLNHSTYMVRKKFRSFIDEFHKHKLKYSNSKGNQLLLKMHYPFPEIINASNIVFTSWKRDDCRRQNMLFLRRACRCCVFSKTQIKNDAAIEAMIYMSAFSLGLDITAAEVEKVKYTMDKWTYRKYCRETDNPKKYCVDLAQKISQGEGV